MFSSQLVYIGSINPIINISAVNIPYIDNIVYETEFHAYTNPIIIKFTNVKFDKIFGSVTNRVGLSSMIQKK